MRNAPLVVILCRDSATRAMLRFLLTDDGYEVAEVDDVASVATLPRREQVCLVVIAGGPGVDVVAMLAALHRSSMQLPAVLLARGADVHLRKRAFGLGARDVVSLPASPRDIQARLRALLRDANCRAAPPAPGETLRAGGLVFNTSSREVSHGSDWHVCLTAHEAALLRPLMAAPGRLIERRELLDCAWSESYQHAGNMLEVYIRRLRAKLHRAPSGYTYIHTVRGQGYVFDARTESRQEPEAPPVGPPRVLVVDDNQPTARMVDEALRAEGYAVTWTFGAEAPALARRLRPALILLDINMPGMDGAEVRHCLRKHKCTASIPVIATSAGANLRAHSEEMEADDFMAKPFSIDELLLRVAKWAGPPIPAAPG